MKMPKPINQAEIDSIIASFEEKIARAPKLESVYRMQCNLEVAKAIGRQRQEAIAAGGPLAEQIKAENEEMLREAQAQYADPKVQEAIEQAKKRCAENAAAIHASENTATKNKYCTNCGTKLSPNSKFCPECGTRV